MTFSSFFVVLVNHDDFLRGSISGLSFDPAPFLSKQNSEEGEDLWLNECKRSSVNCDRADGEIVFLGDDDVTLRQDWSRVVVIKSSFRYIIKFVISNLSSDFYSLSLSLSHVNTKIKKTSFFSYGV